MHLLHVTKRGRPVINASTPTRSSTGVADPAQPDRRALQRYQAKRGGDNPQSFPWSASAQRGRREGNGSRAQQKKVRRPKDDALAKSHDDPPRQPRFTCVGAQAPREVQIPPRSGRPSRPRTVASTCSADPAEFGRPGSGVIRGHWPAAGSVVRRCAHGDLRLHGGGIARNRRQHGAAQAVRGRRRLRRKRHRRAVFDGENAVIRLKGTARPPYSLSALPSASGARRPSRAGGVSDKAGWP